uniref:Uncharacterized protein n=1 Tax=Arion vulgaris TaxID=1028688 RepID=A0A0B7AJJ6_9EUPU
MNLKSQSHIAQEKFHQKWSHVIPSHVISSGGYQTGQRIAQSHVDKVFEVVQLYV